MPSMNKVFLMGHLGRDPEARFTAKRGTPVANLSLATTKRWTDGEGEKQERTEWHRVVVFGQGAEFVREYGRKGSLVQVEGSLQTRSWEDKDGVKRYTTEIVARQVQVLTKLQETPAGEPPADEAPAAADGEPIDENIPF